MKCEKWTDQDDTGMEQNSPSLLIYQVWDTLFTSHQYGFSKFA